MEGNRPPTKQGGKNVSSKRVEDHGGFNNQLLRRCLLRANKTLRGITVTAGFGASRPNTGMTVAEPQV